MLAPNVYFQPPSNITMKYPCIVYNKTGKYKTSANDATYQKMQEYQLTVIEKDPDGIIADLVEDFFQYASTGQYFVTDNLNHTTINLYY
jgi:hypothetical protein